MNIIIKSDEQRAQENEMLRCFGHDPRTADRSDRELAETAARRNCEALKKLEEMQR